MITICTPILRRKELRYPPLLLSQVLHFESMKKKKKKEKNMLDLLERLFIKRWFWKVSHIFWNICSKILFQKSYSRAHIIWSRKFILENLLWKAYFKMYFIYSENFILKACSRGLLYILILFYKIQKICFRRFQEQIIRKSQNDYGVELVIMGCWK